MHAIDYHTLFETVPVGIVFHDAAGRIFKANPAAEHILGLTLDQMQGQTPVDLHWQTVHEDGTRFPGENHPAVIALRDGVAVRNVIMGISNPERDGITWIRIDAVPLFRPGAHKPFQAYAIFQDISEQRSAETSLRLSEELYRSLVKSSEGAIYLVDYDGSVLFAKDACGALNERGWGHSSAKKLSDLLPADVVPRYESIVKQVLKTDASIVVERPSQHDGALRWQRTSFQPVHNLAGRTERVLINAVDITEWHAATAAESYQRNLAEALRDTLAVLTTLHDMDAVLRQILTLAERVVKYETASIYLVEDGNVTLTYRRGRESHATVLPEGSLTLIGLPRFRRAVETGATYLIKDVTLLDDWVPVAGTEWIRSSIGAPIIVRGRVFGLLTLDFSEPDHFTAQDLDALEAFARYTGLAIDNVSHITTLEQKVTERTSELNRAKERVEAILDSCPIGIVLVDADLTILTANAPIVALFNYSHDEGCTGNLLHRLVPSDVSRVIETAGSVLAEKSGRVMEVTAVRCDGTIFDAELSLAYIEYVDNELPGLVCTINDVTTRMQANAALRASEERWQFALEGNGDGVWDWDVATGEVFFSSRWKSMLGYSEDEVGHSTDSWSSRVHADDLQHALGAVTAHLMGETEIYESEHRIQSRDGSYRWILDRGKVVARDEDGRALRFIGTHSDITQHKEVETQMQRQAALQQILMDTALNFINIPIDQLDEGIIGVLGSVSQFNHADRAYIFDYNYATGLMSNTYEWCAEGITPEIENLQNAPMELFPSWVNAHTAGEPVYVPDIDALSHDNPLWQVLQPQGIKSLITIPLMDGKACLGFVGFDAVRERRAWSQTDIVLLKLLAELIVNAMNRWRHEAAIKMTTERLLVSERRLRNAQRIAHLGAWEFDAHSGVVDWSAEVFHLFGIDEEQPAPDLDMLMAYLHEEDRPVLSSAIRRAVEHAEPYEVELRIRRTDGKVAYALARGEPEVDAANRTVRLVGSILDITERKRSETALQQALEREKELNELKTSFVAMASHQLRTPLATILAAAETMLAYSDRLEPQQMVRRLTKIRDQVGHLQAIIGDVLQLTRIEGGHHEYNPEVVDLGVFCAGVIEDHIDRPSCVHGMRFRRPAEPVHVSIDPKLMRQAVENIIENAVKYSPPQSEIDIRLTVEQAMAVLSITDRGIGIPENSVRYLFTPFYRAANATVISGTGLGLPIAKEIVTLHGGQIGVESKVSVGTTVRINLPIHEEV